MADDTPTTVHVVTVDGTLAFTATKDGSSNYTMQTTPRVNGAQVDSTNPMAVFGTVAVSGTTAIGGTVTLAAGSALAGKFGIDQTTPGTTNGVVVNSGTVINNGGSVTINGGSVTLAGTSPVSGTVALSGTQIVQGTAGSGTAVAGNPVLAGARAATASPAAVADGQAVSIMTDKIGRIINAGYAIPENQVDGFTSTATNTASTLFASPGTNVSIYLTDLEISNSSATATVLTFNNTASLQVLAPAGGGREIHLQTPIKWPANTAVTYTSGTSVTSVLVGAQGFKGA